MNYKIKKKSFLLLEVLIGFTLILCFIFPLIKFPHYLFKSEKNQLNAIEFERIANYGFTEIITKLYTNEIKWKDLQVKNGKDAAWHILPNYPLSNQTTIKRDYQLIHKEEKISPNQSNYIKLRIRQRFYFNKKFTFYSYFVILKKGS